MKIVIASDHKGYHLKTTLITYLTKKGYAKSVELLKANSRVKKIKLTIDNKEEYILELNDTNQLQVFDVHYKNDDISKPIVAEFEILEVYKGDKYEDTAMSFLYAYVMPNDIIWRGR